MTRSTPRRWYIRVGGENSKLGHHTCLSCPSGPLYKQCLCPKSPTPSEQTGNLKARMKTIPAPSSTNLPLIQGEISVIIAVSAVTQCCAVLFSAVSFAVAFAFVCARQFFYSSCSPRSPDLLSSPDASVPSLCHLY